MTKASILESLKGDKQQRFRQLAPLSNALMDFTSGITNRAQPACFEVD
jgi:hypothetical protein